MGAASLLLVVRKVYGLDSVTIQDVSTVLPELFVHFHLSLIFQ